MAMFVVGRAVAVELAVALRREVVRLALHVRNLVERLSRNQQRVEHLPDEAVVVEGRGGSLANRPQEAGVAVDFARFGVAEEALSARQRRHVLLDGLEGFLSGGLVSVEAPLTADPERGKETRYSSISSEASYRKSHLYKNHLG